MDIPKLYARVLNSTPISKNIYQVFNDYPLQFDDKFIEYACKQYDNPRVYDIFNHMSDTNVVLYDDVSCVLQVWFKFAIIYKNKQLYEYIASKADLSLCLDVIKELVKEKLITKQYFIQLIIQLFGITMTIPYHQLFTCFNAIPTAYNKYLYYYFQDIYDMYAGKFHNYELNEWLEYQRYQL
jgi:hypothetical protein